MPNGVRSLCIYDVYRSKRAAFSPIARAGFSRESAGDDERIAEYFAAARTFSRRFLYGCRTSHGSVHRRMGTARRRPSAAAMRFLLISVVSLVFRK